MQKTLQNNQRFSAKLPRRLPRGAMTGKSAAGPNTTSLADTLRTEMMVQIIDLISEGPCAGPVDQNGNLLEDATILTQPTQSGGVVQNNCAIANTNNTTPASTGKGYYTAPIIVVVDSAGVPVASATAHATINSTGGITGIVIDTGGAGYTTPYVAVAPSIGKAIYLNNVPLQNDDGSFNFQNINTSNVSGGFNYPRTSVAYRPGTPDQDVIPGFPSAEEVTNPGDILISSQHDVPFAITNPSTDAVRIGIKTGAFYTDYGGTLGYGDVTYEVYVTYTADGSTSAEQLLFTSRIYGKTSSQYMQTRIAGLPKDQSKTNHRWQFRVKRVSLDTDALTTSTAIYLSFYSSVIYTPFYYPNSTLFALGLDATDFSSTPVRAYDMKLLLIQVPSNYFPVSKVYTRDPNTGLAQYTFTVLSANATVGDIYTNNGQQFTVLGTVSGSTTLVCSGTDIPESDGVLTKVSGSGDTSITFTAYASPTHIWDGSFYVAWSDNPAWVYYDMLTNTRYGLGDVMIGTSPDKWSLYTIGQYCDELIPDGFGGIEPRQTCNLYLQTRDAAVSVLSDLASIFRGMVYWAGNALIATADMPVSEPKVIFNESNVKEGTFTYNGTALNARHTVALVRWINPLNYYQADIEYVPDYVGILQFGVRETSVAAVGCTSRGQAHRTGKWLLFTERIATEVCTHNTGMPGLYLRPGDVYGVMDRNRSGIDFGGRVISISNDLLQIVLDRWIDLTESSYNFIATVAIPFFVEGEEKPSDFTETDISSVRPPSTITLAVSNWVKDPTTGNLALNFATPVSTDIIAGAVWGLESPTIKMRLYTCLSVSEHGPLDYEIVGVQYEPNKFAAIEEDVEFEERPISNLPSTVFVPKPPISLVATYIAVPNTSSPTLFTYTVDLMWSSAPGFYSVSYEIWAKEDSGDWFKIGTTIGTSFTYDTFYPGMYSFRVYAYGLGGTRSNYSQIDLPIAETSADELNYPRRLELTNASFDAAAGYGNDVVFITNSAYLTWAVNDPTAVADLLFNEDTHGMDYATLAVGTWYVTVFDSTGQNQITQLVTTTNQVELTHLRLGSNRSVVVFVQKQTGTGSYGPILTEPIVLHLLNPAPAWASNAILTIIGSYSLNVNVPDFSECGQGDIYGMRIWGSKTKGFVVSDVGTVQIAQSSPGIFNFAAYRDLITGNFAPFNATDTFYIRFAMVDSFGQADNLDCVISPEYTGNFSDGFTLSI